MRSSRIPFTVHILSPVTERGATRIERDSLGPVEVPADALYGAHTVRGVANFRLSGVTMAARPDLIAALAHVKAAAAGANLLCGALEPEIANALIAAARAVATGAHDDQFPVDVVHGGGGTVINMNVNEVLANLAGEALGGRRGGYDRVHPNDHANRSQSTNDVYPTALALATVRVGARAAAGLDVLAGALETKAQERGGHKRLGRTCLQDAVPLTIGDTHGAQAHAVRRTTAALRRSLGELLAVPLGATAVGTGIGTPAGYREHAVRLLAEECGLAVTPAEDMFDALANLDGYVDVAAQAVRCALVIAKIASDVRLLSSGPLGGFGELTLPAVQVGSSIMPGKINPAIPELVMQVSFEVRGAAAIVEAAAAAGELELNVMEPVIARHLHGSLADLGAVAERFAERSIAGLVWNDDALERNLAGSFGGAVEDAVRDGYVAVAAQHHRPER